MPRILVIEDDKDIVEIIRYTVEQDGLEVLYAPDGKAGRARRTADRPDLIILDIMMPEMDGYTLNTLLAAQPATKNIPVIVLTAKGQMRDTFVAAPNVQSYMNKPFEPSALQEQIRAVLS